MLVTLTSDFGTADGYVGAMKGVIATLAPEATVVDLAHDVPRHDVAHAAWVLATAALEFPPGTIHVCVVDPGVGGARAEVVAEARGHRWVAPDNGCLGRVCGADAPAWRIEAAAFRRPRASSTFHGRDVFAPAAAALVRGLAPAAAGPSIRLAPLPGAGAPGVVHVDVYGNLITDLAPGPAAVRVAGRVVAVRRTFEDVRPGELVAYVGSAGTLEIAVREGSAAAVLGAARGAPVEGA